ncbi:MAG: hypothetical protein JW709_09885 [Sedimentisphaerales bacterium]|nr:hypothetical protein [Sedimentisphaerales bacterium]
MINKNTMLSITLPLNAYKRLFVLVIIISTGAVAEENANYQWTVSDPVLLPGPKGAFDEVAVKDPTIVFSEGAWHIFYTARSQDEYTTGYVSAKDLADIQRAPRYKLRNIRGESRYGCAPQVFYFAPQGKWYLIFQTLDANYQPAYSTTMTIADPNSWSRPQSLIEKDSKAKWIDFWIICDETKAYLFYTQAHKDVMVRTTSLDQFPKGWGESQKAFSGIHEAVHIYKVKGQEKYHLIYEINKDEMRSFGLATAKNLLGPWKKATDRYAGVEQLRFIGQGEKWTDMVSHGELIRAGYDQRLEYEPKGCRWIIQGMLKKDANGPYADRTWKLGIMTLKESCDGRDML